jgi:hypothetical protein
MGRASMKPLRKRFDFDFDAIVAKAKSSEHVV